MSNPIAEPCVLVIFGASGDLTSRKLIPALFELDQKGELPVGASVLGVSRTDLTDDAFRSRLRERIKKNSTSMDKGAWQKFEERLFYYRADATDPNEMAGLAARVRQLGEVSGISLAQCEPNILFYLSVAPALYEPIIASIGVSGLVTEGKRWCSLDRDVMAWQRIIIEKPFGEDLVSARSLNMALGRVFEEESIFRIDHYLGKELVQNILVLRFANSIFEPLWNRTNIDHVQLTAAESIGVGSRAATFYDSAGAIRDMIQSHLLQVLALIAIEPPAIMDASSIMREKINLLNCAKIPSSDQIIKSAVLGRYGAGGDEPAYVDEPGVDADRRTETFAAMRVEFDNWRWAGVPFYVRSGKRLAAKVTEISIQFKRPPTNRFRELGADLGSRPANRLVIHIAPREGISLMLQGKVPGPGLEMDSAKLDLDYQERFGGEPVEAYGPLLLDAMRGDRTLYKHRDEVEAGWRICEPFLEDSALREAIQTYEPGAWGPEGSEDLLRSEGRMWNNHGEKVG